MSITIILFIVVVIISVLLIPIDNSKYPLITFIIVLTYAAIVMFIHKITQEESYRQGQKDYMNGKINIEIQYKTTIVKTIDICNNVMIDTVFIPVDTVYIKK